MAFRVGEVGSLLRLYCAQLNHLAVVKQEGLLELLQTHKDAENVLRAEIFPAAQKQSFTEYGRDDDNRELF